MYSQLCGGNMNRVDKDKKFIEFMLQNLAYAVYAPFDLYATDPKFAAEVVEDYENYVYKRAPEIFAEYENATFLERMLLMQQGINEYKKGDKNGSED